MARLNHERHNRRVRVAKELRDEALDHVARGKHRPGKNPKNGHKQHKPPSARAEHELRRINELQAENNRLRSDYAELQQKHAAQDSIRRRISEVNDRLHSIERDMKVIKKFIMATIGRSRIAANTSSKQDDWARLDRRG